MGRKYSILVVMTTLLSMLGVSHPVVAATAAEDVATLVTVVYEDQNVDGVYGLDALGVEPALAEIALDLYVDNEPFGVLGGEDKLLASQLSNADGYVVFHGLLPGYYLLYVHAPTGLIATTPTLQAVDVREDAMGTVVEWMFGFTSRNNMPIRVYLPAVPCGSVGR